LNAVEYVHQNLVVHGDIKLTNIMIDSKRQIRLIDFGYSTRVANSNDLIANYSGTPVYLAPEIIKKMPYDGNFN
jgi:serine/threonine protein kinase